MHALMDMHHRASLSQGFMVSQTQPFGTGVSWGLVEGKGEVWVEDVSVPAPGTPACPHFFRPHMAGPPAPHASYLAVPIKVGAGMGGRNDLVQEDAMTVYIVHHMHSLCFALSTGHTGASHTVHCVTRVTLRPLSMVLVLPPAIL